MTFDHVRATFLLAVAGNSKSTGEPPAKKTPGRQHLGFRESALPEQHAMKPNVEKTCIRLHAPGNRPDPRNIASSGPEAGSSHFRLRIQSENILVTESKAIPTHDKESNMKLVLKLFPYLSKELYWKKPLEGYATQETTPQSIQHIGIGFYYATIS